MTVNYRRYEYRVTSGNGPSVNVLGWSLSDAQKAARKASLAGEHVTVERARRYSRGYIGAWCLVATKEECP